MQLLACSTAPRFPVDTIIEYDAKSGICGVYKIVNFETYQIKYVGDIECPSVFGFHSKDIPVVMNWLRDMETYAKAHCK